MQRTKISCIIIVSRENANVFLGWCIPASTFSSSPSTNNMRQGYTNMSLINEVRDKGTEAENRRLCGLVKS